MGTRDVARGDEERGSSRWTLAWRSLRGALDRPAMRNAQLASLAAWTSEAAFVTVLAVYAFEQGGAVAVGAVGFLRLLPAAVTLPFLSTLADRVSRRSLLVWISAVRGSALLVTAAAAWVAGPPAVVYGLAMLATLAFTAFRPAHSALIPSLCTTPSELTSANATRTLFDGVSALVGPLLAGIVIAASGDAAAFLVTAALGLAAAAAMLFVRYEAPPLPRRGSSSVLQDLREGWRAVLRDRQVTLLVLLGASQAFVRGTLNVLVVLLAVQVLEIGESGVGLLWGAFGLGALLGATGTFRLAGSSRIAAAFGVGVLLWGAPLVASAGSWWWLLTAFLLAVVGAGNALVDVSIFTLLQRLVDDRVLGRVLGSAEMLWTAAMAAGSLVCPLLVRLLGVQGALATVGALLVLLVVTSWRGLARVDRVAAVQASEVAILQGVPMLRPLPVPAIEHLASVATRVTVPAGELVFAEGDPGRAYFVIAEGEAQVSIAGQPVRRLGPGDGFGEIALLRTMPRTAEVRAVTALALRALEGEAFIGTVRGYRPSAAVAERLIDDRHPTSGVEDPARRSSQEGRP